MKSEQVHGAHVSFQQRIMIGLVTGACRWPRTVLALVLSLGACSIYLASTRLEYHTQRSDLINPHKDYQQRWLKYLNEFGDDDDIVIVVKGSEPAHHERMQQALDLVAERIRGQPDRFDRLFYQVDLRHLRNRALMFLSPEQIGQIQDNLKSMTLLLEGGPVGWRWLTLLQLFQEATGRAAKLTPGEPLKAADDQFFTQLLSICRSATSMLADRNDYHNPWNSLLAKPPEQQDLLAEPQYFFSGDGTLAFLLARPFNDTSSFTSAKNSVGAAREIVVDIRPSFPELEFGLTGLPVLETDEMMAAENDTHLASWLAIAGVTLLFFIVYRSLYYPLLTVGTLLLGTSLAMGWLTLTVGHLNILSATFAVMLIGMGDYGVLWVMRYETERRRGADIETALRHTAICVGAGTLTAALTTALAFYAAMLADFQAVAELGWIAGSGVLLCALSCFTVLPAILKLADRREFSSVLRPLSGKRSGAEKCSPESTEPSNGTNDIWLPGLAGRSRVVVGVSLVLTIAMAVCAWGVTYDHNLLHLQARGLDSVKWEMTLIDHTAGASWHALSYTTTPEQALALKARYEALPEVSRVVEVASLVPSDQDQKLDLLRDIQYRLRVLPERDTVIAHERPDTATLRSVMARLATTLQPMTGSGGPELIETLRQGIVVLNGRLTDDAGEALRDFEQRMAGDLAADLYRLRDVSTPDRITLDDLPPALRERYIGEHGQYLLQVFGKDCLWDFAPLEHFVQQIQTVDPEATGQPFGTVEGLKAMKNGFERAGVYAFLAIVAVLLCDFRNPKRTLTAISPLGMGVILALGIMGLAGIPLNPANMIALPLVLGVGVDNGVHVLHDFMARKIEGQGRLSRAIGRGVLVKALTTMIGFGTLMISSQRGLSGLGFCLALGVACCMVTALVFLPAVLQLGNHRAATQASPHEGEVPQRLAA
jgi:hopanoid biosynthesis associated RND transporter like protein HpnN